MTGCNKGTCLGSTVAVHNHSLAARHSFLQHENLKSCNLKKVIPGDQHNRAAGIPFSAARNLKMAGPDRHIR